MPPDPIDRHETHTAATPPGSCSIVIRALNEAEHLPRLFEGITAQTRKPDEIILVDSGSTDGTVELAAEAGARVVHIPPGEFTFGRALNLGCEAARGEILVFVSAHVYPTDTLWLERLLAPFEDPRVGLAYGGQTGDHRNHFSEIQLMRRWFPERSDADQKTPFCNNANCAVRRSEWERHRYDEHLTGLEDLAWARDLLARRGRIHYVAEAKIVHVHSEPFRRTLHRYRREAIAYSVIFHSPRIGVAKAAALLVANIGRDYATAVRERALLANIASIPKFRTAQFVGAVMGSRDSGSDEMIRRMYYPRGIRPRGR